MKKSFDLTGLVIAVAFIVILLGWWGIVAVWHPTVSILVPVTYRPVLWVISLAALSVPFFFYIFRSGYGNLDLQRKILLGGLAVLTVSLVHNKRCFIDAQIIFCITTVLYFILDKNRAYRKPAWEYWAVFVYVVWNLVSLAWTSDTHYGSKFAGNFVPMILYPAMFLAFRLTVAERNDIMCLFWRVALMAVLLSLCSGIYEITVQGFPVSGLVHFRIGMIKQTFFDASGTELFTFNMVYGWSGMGHPSYNSLWAVAAAIIGVCLIKSKWIGWIEFVFGELVLLQMQLSAQSRIGIVMMFIVWASAYIYLLSSHRKFLCWSIGSAIVLITALFCIKPDFLGSFSHDTPRQAQWAVAFDFIKREYLLGAGLGGTTAEYVSEVVGYPYPWPTWADDNIYAHNQFIDDWMQSGIFGLVFLVASIVGCFSMSVRRHSYPAFVYCLAMIVFMIIETPFRFLAGITLMSFFFCLFLSPVEKEGYSS